MKEHYQYDLNEYAFFAVPKSKSIVLRIGIGLFLLTLLLNIFDSIFHWEVITLTVVIIAFILFIIIPVFISGGNKYDAIFVTPEYLIQRVAKDRYVAVKFDDIISFKLTSNGIFIGDQNDTIILSLTMFRDDVDSIINILEAKGKTFDQEREFMIRPVKISIVDNTVVIEDVNHETEFDKLYAAYTEEYTTLTPGFEEAIGYRNSLVEKITTSKSTLVMLINKLEVKAGHPENTKFESIFVEDCAVIFHEIKIIKALLCNPHDKNEPCKELGRSLMKLRTYIKQAVISEWKIKQNEVEIDLESGIHSLKLNLQYKDIIIGWNKIID
jgi:hypothetical protein